MRNVKIFVFWAVMILPMMVLAQADEITVPKGQLLPALGVIELNETGHTDIATLDFESEVQGLSYSSGWSLSEGREAGNHLAIEGEPSGYANGAIEWLLLPEFQLPELSSSLAGIRLRFDEWFELETAYDHGRVLVSPDAGATWIELDRRSGSSDWRSNVIDLSRFAGQSVQVKFELVSDSTITFAGWRVDDVELYSVPRIALDVIMNSLGSQNFPFIYMNVFVSRDGSPVFGLDETNFQVHENNVLQTNYFEVTPPAQGGGQRLVDIVFCMDNSGSMGEEQNAVRNNMVNFVNALSAQGANAAFGLVRFGQSAGSGNPIIEEGGVLSENVPYFRDVVWARNVAGGGREPGFDALWAASQGFSYRPGAQRIVILITDEDNDAGTHSQAQVIAQLQATTTTAFCLINQGYPNAPAHYCPIASATNGACLSVTDPFDIILDYIGSLVTATYVVRYSSNDPDFNGVLRHVVVDVTDGGDAGSCSGDYMPGSAPHIERTQATQDLHNQDWAEGTTFQIEANITDNAPPYVTSASVRYKTTGTQNWYSAAMTSLSGNLWRGTIPGSVVHTPGLSYYLTATDDQTTATDPSVDPANSPYTLSILPNQAPVLVHTPITSYACDADVPIEFFASDETNMLMALELYYRRTGQLLYQMSGLSPDGNGNFAMAIPAAYATADGIQYYIVARDNFGVVMTSGTHGFPYSVQNEPCPDPVVEQIFVLPSTPEIASWYEIFVVINNPCNYEQEVTLTLADIQRELVSGHVPWDWEQLNCPPNPPYPQGSTVSGTIPGNETRTMGFRFMPHWYWIPPWNWTQIFSAFLSLAPLVGLNVSDIEVANAALNSCDIITGQVAEYEVDNVAPSTIDIVPQYITIRTPFSKILLLISSHVTSYWAGVSTASGIALLWFPPAAAPFFVAEGLGIGAASLLYIAASDPDSNYTEMVIPEFITLPELYTIPESPEKQFAYSMRDFYSYCEALGKSYGKYKGAEWDTAYYWVSEQLGACCEFSSELVQLIMNNRVTLADVPMSGRFVSPAMISDAHDYLLANGLPEIEISVLSRLGISPAGIDSLTSALIMGFENPGTDSMPPLIQSQQTLLNSFSRLESDFRTTQFDVKIHKLGESVEPVPPETIDYLESLSREISEWLELGDDDPALWTLIDSLHSVSLSIALESNDTTILSYYNSALEYASLFYELFVETSLELVRENFPAYHLDMISLPLEPVNPYVTDVFEDDLGSWEPGGDWTLMYWNGRSYDVYGEPASDFPEPLEPGQAYWLFTTDTVDIDVMGALVSTDEDFVIPLEPGFRHIGNPFNFPVEWNSLRVRKDGVTRSIKDPHAHRWIVNHFWFWDGHDWNARQHGSLVPWEGYRVRVHQDCELLVPPIPSTPLGQIASATPVAPAIPTEFALHPNYPNPFNATTTIRYDVKETGFVSLKVFDLLGREVITLVDGELPAGAHTVNWNATNLPSGLYLCRMEASGFTQTRKLLLLK